LAALMKRPSGPRIGFPERRLPFRRARARQAFSPAEPPAPEADLARRRAAPRLPPVPFVPLFLAICPPGVHRPHSVFFGTTSARLERATDAPA
jgi:hypothetical protein